MSIQDNGYHDDGLGPSRFLPEGRRCTGEGYVGPAEVAEMAAKERIAADLVRGLDRLSFLDMIDTVRRKSGHAERCVCRIIDHLQQDTTYVTPELLRSAMGRARDGLAEALFAIRACRKAVE